MRDSRLKSGHLDEVAVSDAQGIVEIELRNLKFKYSIRTSCCWTRRQAHLVRKASALYRLPLNALGKAGQWFVAHTLATMQNADVIFVLEEGKLLEQGSHTDLLQTRGVY